MIPSSLLAAVAGVNVPLNVPQSSRTVYFGKRRSNTLAWPATAWPSSSGAPPRSSFSSGYDRLGTFMPSYRSEGP